MNTACSELSGLLVKFERQKMRFTVIVVALISVIFGIAIVFGGPTPPSELTSISGPFKSVDFSDLPELKTYSAKDDTKLAYRYYETVNVPPKGSVVLIHGSSASSSSMHVMAKTFAKNGFSAYALDVRGHGGSPPKGTIKYVGQLEDDLEDFIQAVSLKPPSTLIGFSSGGGFALRFAASERQALFHSYLFMSPFIHQNAPNAQQADRWVNIGVPRIVAISLLNSAGITGLNDLSVASFAVDPTAVKKGLTPEYSYALAANFRLPTDYKASIRNIHQPCAVLAGIDDELFQTDKLEKIFRDQGKDWSITLLPGIGHIPLTLNTYAVGAAVEKVKQLQAK
jgi:alpha-beta hydrolase superfamily lysophospholipase